MSMETQRLKGGLSCIGCDSQDDQDWCVICMQEFKNRASLALDQRNSNWFKSRCNKKPVNSVDSQRI